MNGLGRIGRLLRCLNKLSYGVGTGAYGINTPSRQAVDEAVVQLIAAMDDILIPHGLHVVSDSLGTFCIVPYIEIGGETCH